MIAAIARMATLSARTRNVLLCHSESSHIPLALARTGPLINEAAVQKVAAFGGMKHSGLGQESSKYGMDEYLEICRNKARLLSIENLIIPTKVCRRPSNSSVSAKPFGFFLRNLSIAAENFDYVNNSNYFDGVNYVQARGNPQWNSNESLNATIDPQVPQDEDNGSIKGTIEELDNFGKEGKMKEAVECLALLEQQHVAVDLPRLLSLMKLCAEYKALEEAKLVHKHLVRSRIHLEVKIYNKIIEMYCKCGSMDDAFEVFNQMQKRNLTSWDLMITWFGRNGRGEDALELFTQFKELGWKPDAKIFLAVFSACGEVGDIIEGMLQFESMSKDYGIVPSMDHYVSVVSMMGSAGYLDEALEFIENMPIEPNVDVWKTLMNFCRIHGNSELGDRCTDIVHTLEPSCLDEQSRAGLIPVIAPDLAKERNIQKSASQNPPESRSRVHEYRAGDRSCPENEKLYTLLRGLKQQMKEAGYTPELRFVLHDIDPEAKEEAIMSHSEKLAVARGLIDSPARSTMRIIKNLRICGDCHIVMKIISKLTGRELIIRDAKRFHHFRDGSCTCHDYW